MSGFIQGEDRFQATLFGTDKLTLDNSELSDEKSNEPV